MTDLINIAYENTTSNTGWYFGDLLADNFQLQKELSADPVVPDPPEIYPSPICGPI